MKIAISPIELVNMSIAELASLPCAQKAELDQHLTLAQHWLSITRARFNTAMDLCYGAKTRSHFEEDAERIEFHDGPLRVRVTKTREVTWDQDQLAAMAARIHRAGERVEDYLDVTYHIPEARFHDWPEVLQDQFICARTVTPSKAVYELHWEGEHVH